MKKHQFINSRGEVVDLADDDIVPDGFGVRVSAFLIDSATPITDAQGFIPGHRPGFVLVRDERSDAEARDAHQAMVARTSNAWRPQLKDDDPAWPAGWQRPHAPRPQDRTMEVDAARKAYKVRVQNAWRTGQALPDRPAMSAWPQGGWVDRNPSPRPPDVSLDAAPNADAAYWAMVRRQENAWRS